MRGFFGIGIYHPKNKINIGTLWRSAHIFGAAMLFTIGHRYKKQASDTMDSRRHVPMHEYSDFEDFKSHLPYDCRIVAVEITDKADDIRTFKHPQRCVYMLGAEDSGIPQAVLEKSHLIVRLPGEYCLNVSTAGAIVMYDRIAKGE